MFYGQIHVHKNSYDAICLEGKFLENVTVDKTRRLDFNVRKYRSIVGVDKLNNNSLNVGWYTRGLVQVKDIRTNCSKLL